MLNLNGRLNDLLDSTAMVGDIVNPGVGPTVVNFFDYFFSDNGGAPRDNLNSFIQWNVTGGSVDLVGGFGPGVFGAPPEQPTGRYVDLGGSTGNPGLFETRLAFPVVEGQTYNLTFDYRSTGGDTNSATATIGNQSFTVSSSDTNFERFSQTFTATETGLFRLSFQGNEADTDNSGIGVDGILFGQVLGGAGATPGGVVGIGPVTNGTANSDVINGTAASETIYAGEGADTVYGNQGDDALFGNQGTDILYGGQGNDTLHGGRDNDVLFGDRGNDQLFGDLGDDRLNGGEGSDIVRGGQGNDEVRGGQGNDFVFGDLGNDRIWGDLGNDVLTGGQGADTFFFAANSGNDVITDFNRSEGDRLDLQGQTYTVSDAGGVAVVNLSGGGSITLTGLTSAGLDAGAFA